MAGVIPVTMAAQALSFLSSLVLATILGATVGTDAYFLGLSIPMITFGLLLAAVRLGATPALTERFTKERATFARASSEVFTGVAVAAVALSAVTTGLAALVMPAIVSGQELADLTRTTILALAPLGLLGALVGVMGAILAAQGSFVPAAAVLGIEPAAKTALVLVMGDRWGAGSLVVGNLVGSALAVAVLWVVIYRRGVVLRFVRRAQTPMVRAVLTFSVPLLVGQSVLELNPLVDRAMAAGLGSGSVTEFELGLRLYWVPLTLLAGTLISPLTATWANRFASDGWEAVKASLGRAVEALIVFVPPLVVAGVLAKDHLVALLYQGGAYSDTSLARTADVFGMLVLALPSYLLVVVLTALFIVRGDSVFPMKIAIANVVLNLGLNLALRPALGLSGIALATTTTITVLVAVTALVAQRRWRSFDLASLRAPLARTVLSCAAIAGAGAALLGTVDFGDGRLGDLAAASAIAALAAAIHGIVVLAGRGRRGLLPPPNGLRAVTDA